MNAEDRPEGAPDNAFLDDLIAAQDFKNYLIDNGVLIPDTALDDLNRLYVVFQLEAEVRRKGVERDAMIGARRSLLSRLFPSAFPAYRHKSKD